MHAISKQTARQAISHTSCCFRPDSVDTHQPWVDPDHGGHFQNMPRLPSK